MKETLAQAGFPDRTANLVARHLCDAEMKGVRSHGVMRLARYVDSIKQGIFEPSAVPRVVSETSNLITVDGGRGIGITAIEYALDELITRTKENALAAAGIVNCDHTGRIGAYAERAAENGRVAIIIGGGGRDKWPNVAPHGGTKGVISTNPYAFSVPAAPNDPLVCDFATSTLSTGAIVVAKNSGEPLAEGLALDRNGQPTTSANAVAEGGCLLPAAGPKGSGLAMIAEALGSAVMGPAHQFNWLMVVMRADAFRPLEAVRRDVNVLMSTVRATPPIGGVERVMTAGEPERRNADLARQEGIVITERVWMEVLSTRQSLGLGPPGVLVPRANSNSA